MCTWLLQQHWQRPQLVNLRHHQEEERRGRGLQNRIGRPGAGLKEAKEAEAKERRMAVARTTSRACQQQISTLKT
eukprot:6590412-Karenia_brevis.AAC.1